MNIARYDRGAAAAVLARAIDSYRKTDADTARQGFVAMALAVIDPARVVSLVESLPDEPTLERYASQELRSTARGGDPGQDRARSAGRPRGNVACRSGQPEGSDL